MLALQSSEAVPTGLSSHTVDNADHEAEELQKMLVDQVRQRFAIFDVFDTGFIEFGTFRMVLGCLLERNPSLVASISNSGHVVKEIAEGSPHDFQSPARGDCGVGVVLSETFGEPLPVYGHRSILSSSMDIDLMRDVFNYMDTDGDGKVSSDDFRKFYSDVLGWKYSSD